MAVEKLKRHISSLNTSDIQADLIKAGGKTVRSLWIHEGILFGIRKFYPTFFCQG
jgi:hypothetical protein